MVFFLCIAIFIICTDFLIKSIQNKYGFGIGLNIVALVANLSVFISLFTK